MMACSDLLRAVSNVGGERQRTARCRALRRLGLGFRSEGEKEGRGSSRSRRSSLCSKGGQGAREPRWRRHGDGNRGGSVATVATGRRRRGETDQWVPPVRDLSFFPF